ncbi:unnamed protein product [Prorocentrum cordatum]|uniref:Sulfotransferase domain-containing protein n=2 Tax=Prorocentrum cordatum TaxID=2364126 RepID=A0ABN9STG9_9DINO|nr:unnamed protein product [Polarella glacialis]
MCLLRFWVKLSMRQVRGGPNNGVVYFCLQLVVSTCATADGAACKDWGPLRDLTLVNFHVLKTGGTSFWVGTAPHLPKKFPLNANEQSSRLHKGCASSIAGHCSLPELQNCIGNGWSPVQGRHAYITILRDPVDRVMSEFYFLAKVPDLRATNWCPELQRIVDPMQERKVLEKPSLDHLTEWVMSRFNHAHNRQTKQIVAPIKPFKQKRPICLNRDVPWYYELWLGATGHERETLEEALNEDSSLVERAKEELASNFAFVAILERLEESQAALARLLGIEAGLLRTRVHAASAKPRRRDVPEEVLAAIEGRNRADRALYEFAEAHFLGACAPHAPGRARGEL